MFKFNTKQNQRQNESVWPQNGWPKSGHNSGRSRTGTSNKGPDADLPEPEPKSGTSLTTSSSNNINWLDKHLIDVQDVQTIRPLILKSNKKVLKWNLYRQLGNCLLTTTKNSKQHRTRSRAVADKADHTALVYTVESCNILSKRYGCTMMQQNKTAKSDHLFYLFTYHLY